MFKIEDLTAASVHIEAMLGEAKRSLKNAEDTLDYYREEYERAKVHYEAANDAVQRLRVMHRDCEEIYKDFANWRDAMC